MSKHEIPTPVEAVSPLARQFKNWRSGIRAEINFWDKWMDTRGLQWPHDFERRLKPDNEFEVGSLRPGTPTSTLKVLDVGSGPMTVLGSTIDGRRVDLTACDPLAPFYSALAAKHGLAFPVQTEQAFAEDLTAYYAADTFDLVHCQNALDHSFDPIRGIEQMLAVAKPTGRVLLRHAANEAERENYGGFHQWNFDVDNKDFIVWNRNARINATMLFAGIADIVSSKIDDWVKVSFDRIGVIETRALPKADERIREALAAMLALSAEA